MTSHVQHVSLEIFPSGKEKKRKGKADVPENTIWKVASNASCLCFKISTN